ncbi:MAG: glycosyltransferase [Eubacterium sp.]|nr:glycosyltransferase [Eubacterium sp.]
MIKKVLKKLKSGSWYPFYNYFYENLKLDPNLVLMESRGGYALEGNILRMFMELQKREYSRYQIVLAVRKEYKKACEEKLKEYGIKKYKLVCFGSLKYYRYLASAGYLVNDTSFPGRFVKKDGQIYVNTWHGTPLKKMGRDNKKEIYSMGNVQRNLLQSDYLIFPNEYMERIMEQAYDLKNLYKGAILHEGYPRNDVFFDTSERERMRRKLRCENKKMLLYMPTFRGSAEKIDAQAQYEKLKVIFAQVDEQMPDACIMYVKLHPLMKEAMDLQGYAHIFPIPPQYDTNAVMQASDLLVTDYSSVFYDYANTDRPIVFFVYDEKEYEKDRGCYEDIAEYPFRKVSTADQLIEAISNCPVEGRSTFRRTYATWENGEAAQRICRHIFGKEKICTEYRFPESKKENILIYAGDLAKNGITTALWNMYERLDKDRFHYYISFRRMSLEQDPMRAEMIPDGTGILPIASEMNMDIFTMICQMLYLKKGKRYPWIINRLKKSYQREWRKHFGTIKFRHVIHYNGYERYMIELIKNYAGKRTIWVHNEMLAEIRTKGNQSLYQLQDAYREYDNVVVVSEDILESTKKINGGTDNITVIENCHNYSQVLKKSEQKLVFDEETSSTVSLVQLQEILESKEVKFINIGRFSPEKGHKRLIEAFEKYKKEYPDTYLIIIGGTGDLYEQTLMWRQQSLAEDSIIIIKAMRNPMPVLKKCQLFLLSSLYEGLGLVMLEADTLGVPVVSCDVPGPRGFIKKHHGILVEDSAVGLYEGMKMYADGNVHGMNVDYKKQNEQAIQKTEQLL